MTRTRMLLCLGFLIGMLPATALAQDQPAEVVVQLLKTSSSWDGTPLPGYGEGKPEITVSKVTIPPGAQLPMHKHPVITTGVVLSGELTIITEDGQTDLVGPGQAVVEVYDRWHYGRNDGEVPVEIVVFYAGSADTPTSVVKPE